MRKKLICMLFFIFAFSITNKNIYDISNASTGIEQSKESKKEQSIEQESAIKEKKTNEKEEESSIKNSTENEHTGIEEEKIEKMIEENMDLEHGLEEKDGEPGESEQEKNENLASKSRYLTNKGSYMEVMLDAKDGANITAQLQAAFLLAAMKATEEIPYKIIIPEGTYHLSSTVHIYSNTSLLMDNVIFVRDFQEGAMLMSGNFSEDSPYIEEEENIVIQGGTFDGNCFDELYGAVTTSFSNLYFPYAKNIQLIGVKVCNNMGGHHIKVSGVENMIIRDCIFEKYYENGTVITSSEREAVKFGVLYLLSRDGEVEKKLTCNNILVQNNIFRDVCQGIGFDYIPDFRTYQNIHIRNNTFVSCKKEAMILTSMSKSEVSKNRMENTGNAIWIKSLNPFREAGKLDCKIFENTDKKAKNHIRLKIYPMLINSYHL